MTQTADVPIVYVSPVRVLSGAIVVFAVTVPSPAPQNPLLLNSSL